MKIIKTNGAYIRSWCPDIEKSALDQMIRLAELPFTRYCALMPDAHMGMDMPIGGVLLTENALIMNAVGVDAGCGMCAIKTSLTEDDLTDENSNIIFNLISESVPTGFSHNTDKRIQDLTNRYSNEIDNIILETDIESISLTHNPIGNYRKDFASQLGTLGGG